MIKIDPYKFDLKFTFNPANKDCLIEIYLSSEETEKQLGYKERYEEVSSDPQHLIDTINKTGGEIRKRGDLPADNIKYCMVEDPRFAWFYLL